MEQTAQASDIRYPELRISLKKVTRNAASVLETCKRSGITVTGVVKGANALPEVAQAFVDGGCSQLASSRINQLVQLKQAGIRSTLVLLRTAMLSELELVALYADISLHSEKVVLERLNDICMRNRTRHRVVLMQDVGDLREGVFNPEDLIRLAVHVEDHLESLDLVGIGTNIGCYGSVKPSPENLGALCDTAARIEELIGRKLDIISGGATFSLPLLEQGAMPPRVNSLRIGEGILLARDLPSFYGTASGDLHQDTFVLRAEIIEIQRKPTHPVGELLVDAFGNKPEYANNGIRTRALLAAGRMDFGSHDRLIPVDPGIQIVGSSSDHLILDIEDAQNELKVGDTLDFCLYYQALLYLTASPDVAIRYID